MTRPSRRAVLGAFGAASVGAVLAAPSAAGSSIRSSRWNAGSLPNPAQGPLPASADAGPGLAAGHPAEHHRRHDQPNDRPNP